MQLNVPLCKKIEFPFQIIQCHSVSMVIIIISSGSPCILPGVGAGVQTCNYASGGALRGVAATNTLLHTHKVCKARKMHHLFIITTILFLSRAHPSVAETSTRLHRSLAGGRLRQEDELLPVSDELHAVVIYWHYGGCVCCESCGSASPQRWCRTHMIMI